MRSLLKRLRSVQSDEGLGIIEVIAAFAVFSVIAVGMAYALLSMTRLSSDQTSRETATNLAAQQIDKIQTMTDPTAITSGPLPSVTIGTVTYDIQVNVGWVPASGNAGRCGTGGGALLYKRVNVEVTWDGMYLQNPVRADTAIAPGTRINDPDAGTIVVSITGAIDGSPTPATTVTITPDAGGGGEALTAAVPATDADGCTFALKVKPGKYSITISRTGYVSSDNQIAGTQKLAQNVVAGTTLPLIFQYDNAATFVPKYAANSTRNPAIASNMQVTFVGTASRTETTPVASEKLYPKPNGYSAVPGAYNTCLNVNPGNWVGNATLADGVASPTVSAVPGGGADLPIALGVVNVTTPAANSYITAVHKTSAASNGDPGCAKADTVAYTFTTLIPTKGTVVPIALPYGKWQIYTGTTVGALTSAPTLLAIADGVVGVDPATNTLITGLPGAGTVTGSTVVLDPRATK